jgi:putative effector of murein hydrolase LrgA (UPF0299 family)
MKFRKIFSFANLIFCLILTVFLFFRFSDIGQRVIFDWDQERDAWAVKDILSGHFTLLGPRVLGPDKFFLAPYFYYLLAPFYYLANLHPRGMIYFLLFYNLVFFFSAHHILSRLFNRKTALAFLLLWGISSPAIGADITSWNPLLVPLVVILLLPILRNLFENNQKWSTWFWLGLLIGGGINFHVQVIFLGLLAGIFLITAHKLNLKGVLIGLLGFILAFLPLFVFDLRHNFLNWHLLLNFVTNRGGESHWLAWLPVMNNFLASFLMIRVSSALSVIILLFTALVAQRLAKKQTRPFLKTLFSGLAIFFLIFPLGFSLYGQRPSEYYLNFLLPLLILTMAVFLTRKKRRFLLLIIVILIWGNKAFSLPGPVAFNLKNKDQVAQYLADNAKEKEINIAFSVPLGRDTGYRYLFDYYQLNVVDYPAPLYKIVIPPEKEPTTKVMNGIGLFIPE